MKYTKKSLSRDELAERILARGLQHHSKDEIAEFFKYVSYYRISGCWKIHKYMEYTNRTTFQDKQQQKFN